MKALTYKDWRLVGFQVKKKQKAVGTNTHGEALFTREQVKPLSGFDRGEEKDEEEE